MHSPQLSADEQIAWVVPCSAGYIAISQDDKYWFVGGDLSDGFCMAREADAVALFHMLLKAHPNLHVRPPERRVVPSCPSPLAAD